MPQYTTKDSIIEATLEHEGSTFVNDPVDRGGATKYGITLNTYRTIFPLATEDTIEKLTKFDAIYFYTKHIYNKYKLDSIPTSVRDIYFDMIVNHGPGNAGKMLQRVINKILGTNIQVDGAVGPKTLYHLALADQKGSLNLRNELITRRNIFYERIIDANPSQAKFRAGWQTRSNSFKI